MSSWGTIRAEFYGNRLGGLARAIQREIEIDERAVIAPTGSESGPVVTADDSSVRVEGRLRDVSDEEDSAMVLAWFVRHAASYATDADLTWELDRGPRYRWEIREGRLRRLKGALE